MRAFGAEQNIGSLTHPSPRRVASGDPVPHLQPLYSKYPPRTVDREDVDGMYTAVYVLRKL